MFIGQVYANLDALYDFHRMLYVFACVSSSCIGGQCVRVFRCLVPDQNPMVTFISDKDYNAICNKSNEALETTKWGKYLENAEWEEAEDDDNNNNDDDAPMDENEMNEEEAKEPESDSEIVL